MSVNVGDKAPDFTLPTDGGGSVTLSQLHGKPVVISGSSPGARDDSGFRYLLMPRRLLS